MEQIKKLERIFKGLANHRRLMIVKFLSRVKEATVTDVAAKIHLSFKSTSRHLSILKHLDIVDSRQQNLNVYYKLSNNMPTAVKSIIKYISNSYE